MFGWLIAGVAIAVIAMARAGKARTGSIQGLVPGSVWRYTFHVTGHINTADMSALNEAKAAYIRAMSGIADVNSIAVDGTYIYVTVTYLVPSQIPPVGTVIPVGDNGLQLVGMEQLS